MLCEDQSKGQSRVSALFLHTHCSGTSAGESVLLKGWLLWEKKNAKVALGNAIVKTVCLHASHT